MASEKHPHIERASEEQLAKLLQAKDPVLQQIYLEAHRLVLETVPDVTYATDCKDGETGYGIRQYGYDGWGMAVLSAYTRWVSLTLMHGRDLEDPAGLLEGTKRMRHIKLRSLEQFAQVKSDLQRLLELASKLHTS